jgi:pimeloyl-ACP methyl ester carboxylesterase
MLTEQIATDVGPAGLDIAYQLHGDPNDPPVLLIMGLAAQLVHWPEGFVDALVGHALQVIRFDNRDAGRSTHIHDAPRPDLRAALAGDLSSASYTFSDMAADAVGLLDALGIGAAHVVGASLGGAIAQTMAIEHPDRVLSLVSMMSTTGNVSVGQAHPDTLRQLFGGPPATTRDEAVERAVRAMSVIGSPAFPPDLEAVADRAGRAFDRDHDPVAVARQGVASVASGDRTDRLRTLRVPTLVVHGVDDTLCDVSGARATAAAVPGAELVLIDGMGHELPRELWPRIADLIAGAVRRGTARTRRASPVAH